MSDPVSNKDDLQLQSVEVQPPTDSKADAVASSPTDAADAATITTTPPRRRWIRFAVIGGVLIAAALIAVIVVFTTTDYASGTAEQSPQKLALTLEDVLDDPQLAARRPNGTWHADNKWLQLNTAGDLQLYDVADGSATTLLEANSYAGILSKTRSFKLSADGLWLLLERQHEKLNRHSRLSTYVLLRVGDTTGTPRRYVSNNEPGSALLEWATFGPVGSQLVFVQDHDVYYLASSDPKVTASAQRLTHDGSVTLFNGVCDWVYEEEIFGRPDALWFAPDGKRLALARFDDAAVHAMHVWHYGREDGSMRTQYPDGRLISYPKVGTANPSVQLVVVELENGGQSQTVVLDAPLRLVQEANGGEPVLSAVRWASGERLVAVWKNREQDRAYVEACEIGARNGGASSAECRKIVDHTSQTGWVDISEPLHINTATQEIAFLFPVHDNLQIHTYPLLANVQPQSRQWTDIEVFHIDNIVHWTAAGDRIYFHGHPVDTPQKRHLYSVDQNAANAGTIQCLTCTAELTANNQYTHFNAQFRGLNSEYLILEAQGPAVPQHTVYRASPDPTADLHAVRVLQSNALLAERLNLTAEPLVQYLELPLTTKLDSNSDTFTARVRLLLPPGHESRAAGTKYPMLVHVYAGPSTYAGTTAWSLGWSAFLASNRSVVVAQIDGRGSGRRGQRHMNAVYRRLGSLEVADQIDVAAQLATTLDFIDAERVGVWGHSYGGYATGMVLATDEAKVFRCGIMSAPVTDWRLYDTLYTERYMGRAEDNGSGYDGSSLLPMANRFRDRMLFLVHGTADDNVHYQMSMLLAQRLERSDIEFDQMSFPDEDHSLDGVTTYRYTQMTKFFDRCFA